MTFIQSRRRNRRGNAVAEFGPTLWMFFILFLLPFLDLLSFATGVGTTMFMANMAAHNVASASTYGDAQASAAFTEQQLSNFMKFSKMTPIGGATGLSIAVVVAPMGGGSAQTFSAPGSIPYNDPSTGASPNPNNTLYSWLITANYNVSPIFNFNGTPWLSNVPALGSPVPIKFTASATVEHPDGLNTSGTSSATGGT